MIMSKGRKAYQIVINIILLLVSLCMILPLVLLFMSSITDENTLVANGYSFFPAKLSTGAYQYILQNSATVFRAYGITVLATIIGTSLSIILSSLMAFPLSLKDLPGRRIITFYVFFTMLFSGGLVPSYIMWTTTFGIRNTIWAYIFPNFLLGAFNIILVRTFFATSIPADIYEAAKIDGAGYMTIYWKIVLPLGKPILVTIGLFTGLSYWNDWTNGLYYINKSNMFSIQTLLNRMIQDIQALAAQSTANSGSLMQIPQVSIRMAIAFVAILPILVVYPFLQKYFASGIMLGAVKG
ncbi:carbohydrate ABC transporter permease [Acutalibacter muris]|jgi:putative aldouronate transport system permease protein|uniref:Carbohydrate ABC transporter permease n=1 Tax=Acutalibacter muris TaxID=1796620 RepID=A0A1Z2XU69_9FIRM|nr:carbohydrate ABC transporter permease [Acutalibacter muris]ANU54780.1 sugar ABC transporter permease [Hungateiclostridiaceae bacterium KB18]ASB41992.1 carbohydrate ABC transporter permease [Acutalibacter muris]MCI9193748.1 carbohydrate ABC transporter permease [Acutalibacter muris]MCI9544267.1 carbohydrate ABC transporter permease [Acutalibacter muris]QQR31256.1 carbohydrate ABC transporter permease [Acutalibacter muris]